jgi:hypothetical protein
MKKLLFLSFFIIAFVFTSCKKDSTVVTPPAADITVSSVAPTSGNAGTVVAITGTNFGTDKTALTVTFGTVAATIDSIIGGITIQTKVPQGVVLGSQTITVTKAGVNGTVSFNILDPIVGTWVSQGSNVAYGLRLLLKTVKIVAVFNANNTYTVNQTDSSNTVTTFTGTYSTTASTYLDTASLSFTKGATIINIVANQATPSAVISTGIYAISSTNMSYEIIQTSPALGVNPPTPAGGFGSTSVGVVKYPIYVQKYVKQ